MYMKLLAGGTLVLAMLATAEANAQHTIRRSNHAANYHSTVIDSGAHYTEYNSGYVDHGGCCNDCNSCCSPCVNLCMPNPCRVFDRIGTAISGLGELFRCRCCYSHCHGGNHGCCGVIDEHMPYLDHTTPEQPQQPIPTPAVDPAPSRPPATSAYRVPNRYQALGRPSLSQVRSGQYRQAPTVRQTQATQPKPQISSVVKQTSYQEPAAVKPIDAKPIPKPATGKVRVVNENQGNPLR